MSVRSWALLVTASALAVSGQALVPSSAPAVPATTAVSATDTWGPVHRFERNPLGQSLVVDARGVTTVVWGSQRGWPEPVKVEQRTAAGRWGDPVTLGEGYHPVVAADADGNLTVAWLRDRKDFTTGVWAARKPVGKPWTQPVHLSEDVAAPGYPDGDSFYGAGGLDIAVHPGGAALVTWSWGSSERDVPFRIQAVYRPSEGPWGSLESLTPAAGAINAQIAFARSGIAWVAYELPQTTGPSQVKVRSRSTAGLWSPASWVGNGSVGEVRVIGRGDVTVVFRGHGQVRVAMRPAATGAWKAPFPVTPANVRVSVWSVAMNRAGAAVVAYLVQHGRRVDVVRRAVGSGWTKPLTLATTTTRLSGVFTAINPRGDMFAGWDTSYAIWGRYRPAGQGWHATTTAHPDTGQVDVLEEVATRMGPGGNVVLLWAQEARPLRARILHVS